MAYEKTSSRLKFMNKRLLLYFISICAVLTTIYQNIPSLDIRPHLTDQPHFHIQESLSRPEKKNGERVVKLRSDGLRRRFLSGPGSWPPRCNSKCGKCRPCKPVHVPVPPGTPVTTEYYPEAWRCKCGNKLYMP